MGTQNLFLFKSHFDSVDKGFVSEFLYKTMFRFANSIWVFVYNFFFHLSGFIVKYTFRYHADDQIAPNNSAVPVSDGFGEKENYELSSGFQFQNSEDSNKSIKESESSVLMEKETSTLSTSKYQFLSGKDFSGFMAEPETVSFTVQELFVGPIPNDAFIINHRNQNSAISADRDFQEHNLEENHQNLQVGSNDASIVGNQSINARFSAMEDFEELCLKAETIDQEKGEDSVQSSCNEEDFGLETDTNRNLEGNLHNSDGVQKGRFSEKDLGKVKKKQELENIDGEEESEEAETVDQEKVEDSVQIQSSCNEEDFGLETDTDRNLEGNLHNSDEVQKGRFSEKDLGKVKKIQELENIDGEEESEETISNSGSKLWNLESDSEDEEGLEILWEHRDLIEQMKTELRNARSRRLPTILEESDTLKMMEDLKPLKIDEKFEHKDCLEEIQKVYKSYAEKMRKLDILNNQTMHAISFLHLKESVKLPKGQRSISANKSFVFLRFWPSKLPEIFADPTLKSITELHRDLELVYIGQVCLSWEILHWQYMKAKELLQHDSQGHHPYNQVAAEFQQFQVLAQRFVENEQFQGTRIQNYVKNRCILRVLLQVPAIKDNCVKDKKESVLEGSDVISIAKLTKIIEESMHVFWEFLRADKDETNAILKGFQRTHADLQNPSHSELLMDIKTNLQKKERRLKDIMRSGNCIVKKLQKRQRGRLDHALFLAQVELGLASRVLNMARLTSDQLVWCQKKLNKINFVSRKIHMEPSFLLFPF